MNWKSNGNFDEHLTINECLIYCEKHLRSKKEKCHIFLTPLKTFLNIWLTNATPMPTSASTPISTL